MSQFPLTMRRSEQVIERLRQRLSQPDARAGARLPSERDLAQEFSVSRRVIREALQALEAQGLVKRSPGVGTLIIGMPRSAELPVSNDIRHYTSPIELMDARYALEPTIAAMAALHATSHDIDQMTMCLWRSEQAGADHQQWEVWDGAFHQAIGQATNNAILIRFFQMLTEARAHTEWGNLRKASLTSQRQAAYTRQHKAILSAIEARDSEQAARMMREHLSLVRRTLLTPLEDDGLSFIKSSP